jgi:tetratricopeptide (TPR) repeat protein
MSRTVRRRILLAGLGFLLVAGAALGAYTLLGRREVTTSSSEALRFYRLGRANEWNMYFPEAMADYAEALKHDPNFAMATIRLAGLLRDRDPERARALVNGIRPFLGSVSERERFQFRLFEMGMDHKGPNEMEPVVDEYIGRFPDDPDGYFMRSGLYRDTGRMQKAVADLEKVIALNPNTAYAYNLLGYYWLGQGDYPKAEEYLQRYRFLAPDQANPYDSLGELYIATGRYGEAEETLKKALEVKPDFYYSLAHLGTLEVARGNLPAAAEQFRSAAEKTESPGLRRNWLWSATLSLALAGKSDEAMALMEKWPPPRAESDEKERQRSERGEALRRSGILALVGRTREAAAGLDALPPLPAGLLPEEKEDFDRGLAGVQAVILEHEGRHKEAAAEFERAIPKGSAVSDSVYFPGRDMLCVLMARSLIESGETAEAEAALKPVLSRNPTFQPALDVLAGIKGGTPAPARS